MIRDITIGRYYDSESVIHRMDPRTKLMGVLVYIISLFLVKNVCWYIGCLIVMLVLYKAAGVPFGYLLKGLRGILLLLFFTFLFRMLYTPGDPVVHLCFEASGAPSAVVQGMDILRNRGVYLVPGQYSNSGGVVIQPQMITFKALHIIGSSQYSMLDVNAYLTFLDEHKQLHDCISKLGTRYHIEEVNRQVDGLSESNNKIVENISQLSAATEEVTASAEQVHGMSEQNLEFAEQVQQAVDKMRATADDLKKYL